MRFFDIHNRACSRAAIFAAMSVALLAIECRAQAWGGAVPPVTRCSSGDTPEHDIQGRVPFYDRLSGRSAMAPYSCNLRLVGQYQGEGSSWVSASSANCAFMSTSWAGDRRKKLKGTLVIDASNPSQPVLSNVLATAAMRAGSWETLKVSPDGKYIAAAGVRDGYAENMFDLYDISSDCTHPRLMNAAENKSIPTSIPVNNGAHESAWSPDSKTFWTFGFTNGEMTAIDISNPNRPKVAYRGPSSLLMNHGASFSPDGNLLYLTSGTPAGVAIIDVSEIQNRRKSPRVRQLGALYWLDGAVSQHTIPVSYNGRPHIYVVDEGLQGGVRLIDVSRPQRPKIIKNLRLSIQLPAHQFEASLDLKGNGLFGYESHYCSVDRQTDPSRLACGIFQSGIRVFDISSPMHPAEIAYFNPPAQPLRREQLPGSEHVARLRGAMAEPLMSNGYNIFSILNSVKDTLSNSESNLSTDLCSSPPRFVGPDQLWVTCQDNGFMVLKFTGNI